MTTTANTPAKQDNSPGALVARYRQSFISMLPSHLRAGEGGDVWIAGVEAVLRTRPEIAQAAANDTGAFMAALVPAAQRGLTPGTEEYYLVPFAPRAGEKRVIQGIIGYQGLVELIYRAGAVSSVIVEVVKRNDKFTYRPGRDERPDHEVDWFGGDRGDLIGAYAYAIMKDGATSKVVVMGPDEIARAKAKSASAASKYSPWTTNPEAMWLKSAARQLAKWVPTSAEYRRQALRDAQAVMDERRRVSGMAEHLADFPVAGPAVDGEYVDPVTGEVLTEPEDQDIVDAELVEDRAAEQAPEGTVGGEASVPAGAPQPPAPAPAAAQKTRPAAGASPAPVDVPQSASQAGAGEETPATATAGVSSAPAGPVIAQHQPGPDDQNVQDDAAPEVVPHRPGPILARQKAELRAECIRLGIQSVTAEKLMWMDMILGMPEGTLRDTAELDRDQAVQLIAFLKDVVDHAALEVWGAGQNALLDESEG